MLRFNRISKKKEKKEKILDNNWKINSLLGEITRYRNIDRLSSHIIYLKNEKSNHLFSLEIETFFVVDRNGFETSYIIKMNESM